MRIAGYYGLGENRIDDGLLERMGAAQHHRGPEDSGTFVDGLMGIVHQRLSIIDREGGRQPMATADGRYTLAYNGEVYNYRELRAELEGRSRTFATESDTEVVLQAFAEWGADAFDRFNGMFAIDPGCRRRLALLEREQTDPLQRALPTSPISPTTYTNTRTTTAQPWVLT